MCAVCAMYDWGMSRPNEFWNLQRLEEFKKLIEAAKVADTAMGLPDCEDPEKAVVIHKIGGLIKSE